MSRVPIIFLLLSTLTLASTNYALTPQPQPRPTPAHTTSSPLTTLFPAISSALRDLSAVQTDDVSFLTVAKRNLRFVLSGVVGPLQLLDWSHWSTDPFASAIHSQHYSDEDEWRAEEDDFAAHGDPSHELRVTVDARKQSTAPHRLILPPQPTSNDSLSIPPHAATDNIFSTASVLHPSTDVSSTVVTTVGTDVDRFDEPDDTCFRNSVSVRFTRFNSTTGTYHDTLLCYCPADYSTRTCGTRRAYRCQLRLATDAINTCAAVRATAVPTLYSTHSERLPTVHLSSSASEYYTYEPTLSGPVAPCLSLTDERSVLAVNFTCHFINGNGANIAVEEGFDKARLADRLSRGYVLNDTLPVLRYTVKNVDDETGDVAFAVTGNIILSISARLHNTAHPSQYVQNVLPLAAAHLQTHNTTGRTQPLAVLAGLASLDPNLKRGGRLLLALRWHDGTGGIVTAGSGLPWQLTVEDGTWVLPEPRRRVWLLSGWQTAVVVLAVAVVMLLWVWRWYQIRQTERMQALLAQQRGKQQSWFKATE